MIECMYRIYNGLPDKAGWQEVPKKLKYERAKLCTYYYKINNTVYFMDSKAFRVAFEKARMWEKLNDTV